MGLLSVLLLDGFIAVLECFVWICSLVLPSGLINWTPLFSVCFHFFFFFFLLSFFFFYIWNIGTHSSFSTMYALAIIFPPLQLDVMFFGARRHDEQMWPLTGVELGKTAQNSANLPQMDCKHADTSLKRHTNMFK